ncbi:hypothetical protein JDV02_000332 [Purpureocillium takamizusanense]|uniref:PhnB-like domain-containing protein n=1 Tax=Purpureocillium takamizusanense TaxID=2060973 RepID=A0A9Q8Q5V2_9HYPO|nr:uncharacterized protein JDV02_000332 [Purpureocillium takamizusanense]UNI13605.1 hypothetical protein JDV02_000332 [Purpureocillium takamizusanense]
MVIASQTNTKKHSTPLIAFVGFLSQSGRTHCKTKKMSLGITTCLLFNNEAGDAADFYVSVFAPNSRIITRQHYSKAGQEMHGQEPGSVLLVEFELGGRRFVALNGGTSASTPPRGFNESVSFQVDCADQAEVDRFWDKLSADPAREQCSWLADKYGVSWQIVPKRMKEMLAAEDRAAADRAMVAMMGMKKLDIAALEKAFAGE